VSVKWYDISPKMLAFAEERLHWWCSYELIEQDISNVIFKDFFDACVSVLAVHHLNSSEKKVLFQKIFDWLTDGWIFVLGDRIDFSDINTKRTKLEFFKNFLIENLWKEEGNRYYNLFDKEDQPDTLEDQIQWLEKIWFSEVVCIWEYSIYAVLYAIK
jgi:tRNA (cmo5U34)-methyltransferase